MQANQSAPRANTKLVLIALLAILSLGAIDLIRPARATAQQTTSMLYTFNAAGVLRQSASAAQSSSPYLWIGSGGALPITNGTGAFSPSNSYSKSGVLRIFSKSATQASDVSVFLNRTADVFATNADKTPYSGEFVLARYQDNNTFYIAGIRADGYAVIKKKIDGVYQTLATTKLFNGTYSFASHPDLIPLNIWIGLRLTAVDQGSGVHLTLFTDVGKSGTWKQVLASQDASAPITKSGLAGMESDYGSVQIDNFLVNTGSSTTPASESAGSARGYDATVLADSPALYLPLSASSNTETDASGHGLNGSYKGGRPGAATLPNGDKAADFNGTSQYLSVPSSASLSISHTGELSWEGWVRADTLNFPVQTSDGYVDWMGKCALYGPTCEWEARMYGAKTPEGRPDRFSAYVFNPSAGLGSAADWQPASGVIKAGEWVYVVAEYQTKTTPAGCSSKYPGSIDIWVNGIKQNFADHAPTGCMSQYNVRPVANNSPLTIGTMALDSFFKGAVGKVAIYDRLLSQAQINAHFAAMTGKAVSGSCGETCSVPSL